MKKIFFYRSTFSLVLFTFVTSALAYDCRVIYDPGYSETAKALIGKKYELVDEEKIIDPRVIPFRIYVQEDLDLDPETLTLKLTLAGLPVVREKIHSEGFNGNLGATAKWLKDLPSCEQIYRQ